MAELVLDTLREAWTNYLAALTAFLPRLLATLSIVLAGWLLALLLGFLTRVLLGVLRLDALAERSGAAELLRKVGLPVAHRLAGSVVFWLVFVGFLISGIDALGFRGVEGLMREFMYFVPRLVVALVVLVVGVLAANFAWRAALIAAVNAQLAGARLLAGTIRILLVALTVAMALEQIGVARAVVLTAFAIAFGAVMLAAAIAFGVAAGGVFRRILDEQLRGGDEKAKEGGEGMSHL
jgi:hypothetical protein